MTSWSVDLMHQNTCRTYVPLFNCLQDNGLYCRKEKCLFAQPSVEYLGYTRSSKGVAKGRKVDAVRMIPPPDNVSSLCFLPRVNPILQQIPSKSLLLLILFTNSPKRMSSGLGVGSRIASSLSKSQGLTLHRHCAGAFRSSTPRRKFSCVTLECGLGAVLFHHYPVSSERPIGNVSKTLTDTQRRYSQIQKEAGHRSQSLKIKERTTQWRKISASLSTVHGCLLHGSRVIIPPSLQLQVLELLHLGHFRMQRMKQLVRTAVYWPRIEMDIMNQCST